VELYTHQALTIVEAYIDCSDRRFPLKKWERDAWSEKYVLSIPKEMGIPVMGKGTKRLYFKIDINCKEGLMHEYGISGMFKAHGMKDVEVKEKTFQYSCKVGEFRQIFDSNPDEASVYAEKRLKGKYSSNSIHIFTNSFRMIHELSRYCHSGSVRQEGLISKLQTLHASFEKVPEITGEHIIPLIKYEMDQLNSVKGRNEEALTPGTLNLCDKLVEYLHMEVMGAEVKSAHVHSVQADDIPGKEPVNAGQKECPVCGNVITESNKSLVCMKCRSRFCLTCEEWFREERKRGEKPLCEKCFGDEQEKKRKAKEKQEHLRKEEEKRAQREKDEQERQQREEQERLRKEQKEKDRLQKEDQEKRIKEENIRLREEKRLEEYERWQKQARKIVRLSAHEGRERDKRDKLEKKKEESKQKKKRSNEEKIRSD